MSRGKLRLELPQKRRTFKSKNSYLKREAKLQMALLRVQQAYFHQGRRAVIVFEGWDASGKGGSIRRLTAKLDPRAYKVWPIGAPSAEEQGRHYLYRFWTRLPIPGTIAIYDRSWYGRVLVERLEGFVDDKAGARAYDEINEFEHLLAVDGVRIIKLFMHITPDEQLRRFTERLHNPVKRWKLTREDLRNRARWQDYETAYQSMFDRTSTKEAPWTVVPANHKWTARITVLNEVIGQLSRGVNLEPPELDHALVAEAERELGIDAGL
jgi:polyphosphate kinase 2 (PPK2 family)